MNTNELLGRIRKLEFHQKLLLKIIKNKDAAFFQLVVEKNLTENEMECMLHICEEMSNRYEKQKAEGFVYFYPLLKEFIEQLHDHLEVKEVIDACLRQKLYVPIMSEFKKYLS